MKHIPGPWMYEERCSGIAITDSKDDETIIAMVIPYEDEDDCTDEQEANAKLIAAAPELLDALINMRKEFDKSNVKYADWIATKEVYDAMSIIDQAIKKATE